ncbi:MAG TPA: MFS transporter [Deltaproteobacteria bacterium]|nr:MFS transporter [Deltaproteobacteria bacterium]
MALSPSIRHGYGVAAFSLSLANTAVLFFLLKFLIDHAGLSPGQAGGVLLVGKLWDAVSDPLVGRLSDRTHTAMGARRPWILGASVPFAALFASLWWGIGLQGSAAAAAYAVLLVLYNTAYTAVVVPYGALTPALTTDYDERTALNGARMGWSMLGGIVAGICVPALQEHTGGLRVPGVVLGVLILPGLWWMVAATAGRDTDAVIEGGPPMWTVLRNRAFRRIALLFLSAWSSIAVLSSLIPFYVEHHVHRPDLLDALFATIQISALVSVPLVVRAAERSQKHVAYGYGMISWGLVLCLLAGVGPGQPELVIGLAIFAGAGVAAAHVLPWAMLPDVVEADTLEQGQPRAGAFYGMMTFLEKLATAVALWAVGAGLQLAGYAEGAATQPEGAVRMIRVLLGPLPAVVLTLAGLYALARPPLTRGGHQALVAKLEGEP